MKRRRWLIGVSLAVLTTILGFLLFLWGGGDGGAVATMFRRDQTWQQMQTRATWRIGMDPSFPPFELLDEQGTPVGLDVDLARAIAKTWGMKVEIEAIGFDSLLDALKAGKIDSIVSAYPYDERLTRDFLFSDPYFDAGLRLVVRDGSPIREVANLADKRVAVEWGSVGDMVGRRLERQGIAMQLVPFETPEEAIQALRTRQDIDALFVDNVTLRLAQSDSSGLAAIGPPLEGNPYVIVMPLRASELRRQLSAALSTTRDSGTLSVLEEQWFATGLQAVAADSTDQSR